MLKITKNCFDFGAEVAWLNVVHMYANFICTYVERYYMIEQL